MNVKFTIPKQLKQIRVVRDENNNFLGFIGTAGLLQNFNSAGQLWVTTRAKNLYIFVPEYPTDFDLECELFYTLNECKYAVAQMYKSR